MCFFRYVHYWGICDSCEGLVEAPDERTQVVECFLTPINPHPNDTAVRADDEQCMYRTRECNFYDPIRDSDYTDARYPADTYCFRKACLRSRAYDSFWTERYQYWDPRVSALSDRDRDELAERLHQDAEAAGIDGYEGLRLLANVKYPDYTVDDVVFTINELLAVSIRLQEFVYGINYASRHTFPLPNEIPDALRRSGVPMSQ